MRLVVCLSRTRQAGATMVDVSVVITAHAEGLLAGPACVSALAAMEYARLERGVVCEVVVVLDRADTLTREVISESLFESPVRYLVTDTGDPGQARNAGVRGASGEFVTFLDADDLWSKNWISEAFECSRSRSDAIWHSACNVAFGDVELLWWHVDSESSATDISYLRWGNYWDSMSFGARSIYLQIPFRANDLPLGFGHEDWHWNLLTLSEGFVHKPVPGTIHFKRRRAGSQMSKVVSAQGEPWPLERELVFEESGREFVTDRGEFESG